MQIRNHLFLLASCTVFASAQTGANAVLTGQYNAGRTSSTSAETILNTSNVSSNEFGKLFSWTVDGWVYAQPLYVPGVQIRGVAKNVVYVATMNNSIYAFDADRTNPSAAQLWKRNLGRAVAASTANGCPSANFTGTQLGILSTPVVDPSTNTLYAISTYPSGRTYAFKLHAMDLATGREKFGGPVVIHASVSGSGYNSRNGTITLGPASTETQRTSLLLSQGTVYAGFGNCGPDNDPWHGWVLGYNASNLSQKFVFNTTPNGGQGGVWQSGRGIAADRIGDVYFNTGNATWYNENFANPTTGTSSADAALDNYPMRFMQLTHAGQFLASYPPANYANLNLHDLDFSSSGPLLIPGTSLLVTGGKDGIIYLFNSNNLNTPVQSFQATGGTACSGDQNGCDQIHDLAFANNTLYIWGTNDILRAYSFERATSQFKTTPSSMGTSALQGGAPTLAVSSNAGQSGTGIVWVANPDNTLHAFDASNVANELWNSSQNYGRDALPSAAHFVEPTVANGRVYLATFSNQIVVYGLLSNFSLATSTSALPVNTGSSAAFSITTDSLSGSAAPIRLAVMSGLPAGATASFNPAQVDGSGSSTVTITTASGTPPGSYNLIVSGSRQDQTRTSNVLLQVTTPDTTPPKWSCCTYSYNGSNTITFTGWDTQSGMKSITAVQVVNATYSIPQFPVGTTSPINFSATESGWSSYVKFQLTNRADESSYIDAIFVDPERQPGRPIPYVVKNVTSHEGIITIQNQTPGLKNVRIEIDAGLSSAKVEVAGLKDGETRVVDIKSKLHISGPRTVTITPHGKPGGRAMFVFANVAMVSTR